MSRFNLFVCAHVASRKLNRANAPVNPPSSAGDIDPYQAITMRADAFKRIISIAANSSSHVDSSRDGFAIAGIISRIACDFERPKYPIKGLDLRPLVIDHALKLEARRCASTLLTLLYEAFATEGISRRRKGNAQASESQDDYGTLLLDVFERVCERGASDPSPEECEFLLEDCAARSLSHRWSREPH